MPISAVAASQVNNMTSSNTMGTAEIKQEDFFSIMIDQLKNQNPLSPTDNSDFLNQLVQFSTMDQMKSIDQRIAMTEAFQLIGKTVVARSSDSGQIEGEVLSVLMNGKEPLLEVNGEFVNLKDILLAAKPIEPEIEAPVEEPPIDGGEDVL